MANTNEEVRVGYVRTYQDGDIECIAERMREADQREVQASAGLNPEDALRRSLEASHIVCTVVGERPAAMFGISPLDETTGAVWLLGTDELTTTPLRRQFLKQGRRYFDLLHEYRPLLCNFVDERNTLHIRWLKWCGCVFINRHEHYGVEGRPFLEFVRINNHV